MSKHDKFIMTPITSVIKEMKYATSCIGAGIETYPLWDYVLQATFTKMTGFQEQKMKCIDWELATNGYDYRRSFLENINEKGTYSTYDSKNKVYNALINEIARLSGKGKKDILNEMKSASPFSPRISVQQILENTNVAISMEREFSFFLKSDSLFKNQFWVVPKAKDSKSVVLFESVLQQRYSDELYKQRNRIAHNTLSYQQNLPEFETLKSEDGLTRNYFFWFALLVLIDDIFMKLYEVYSECLQANSYFED